MRAEAGIRRLRSREPGARAIAAAGVAALILGGTQGSERAVRDLELAAGERPLAPAILSDLAAAYYVRAQRDQDPADLIPALLSVNRALASAPRLPEALFNRGLILAHLHLNRQAIDAWDRYRGVDAESGWSKETQQRIAALGGASGLNLPASERGALAAAALSGRTREIVRVVAKSPQVARELAMNELLPDWGERFLHADRGAAAPLSLARAIGAALIELHGDRTILAAVKAIDRATAPGVASRTGFALAAAHVAFAQGQRLAVALSPESALPLLRQARTEMLRAKSPMACWAAVALGGVEIAADHHDRGIDLFTSVMKGADPLAYPALHGRANWGLGLIRVRQGRFAESLDHYRRAAEFFLRSHEVANQASIHSLIAENRKLLGQPDLAWRHRLAALAILSVGSASRQLHNVLWEGADFLLQDSAPDAALAFADEDVAVAGQLNEPLFLAVALLQRSHVHAAGGQIDLALSDLAAARDNNARTESRITRERVEPDLDLAEAELLLSRDPRQALVLLAQAVRKYDHLHRHIELARAMLSRARALLTAGATDKAAAQLQSALDLFYRQRETIGDPQLLQTYSETAQDVFDEMILLQVQLRRDPLQSFAYSEQARLVPNSRREGSIGGPAVLGPASTALTRSLDLGRRFDLSRVPGGVTIVEYSLTKERLLVWVLRHGTIDAREQRIEIGKLERDIVAWLRALREADEVRLEPAAAALYRLLIPPAVTALPPDSQVVFVPDKILNAVPFAALRNPLSGRYLIEESSVSVAPSVSYFLTHLEGRSTTGDRRAWSSLLVADPIFDRRLFPQLAHLPGAAAETDAAQRSYGNSVVLAGPAAAHSRLLAELDRHEIFSFAGHAVDNPRDPASSYLVLSGSGGNQEPGILFGREIAAIHLRRLRLVILSACHTAAASRQRIAGLAGLAGAFLDAGAAAVLGTLWEADDQAASRLLQEFHRRFGGGLDSATALRAAQLALLHGNEPSLRSPGRWGAFEAIGEVH